jgi:hypothetical protein
MNCSSVLNTNHGIEMLTAAMRSTTTAARTATTATGPNPLQRRAEPHRGQHVSNNDYGIQLGSTNTFVFRNTATGNRDGNYSVGAGTSSARSFTRPTSRP